MGSSEKFCLKWNDFEKNISGAFREIREDKDFFDVTLACDDDQLQAHKVILSACSPFFRTILRRNKHDHPLLYLKGVKYADLVSVLNFMYHGEVNVAQEELNSFLAVAEDLKVKGLTQSNSASDNSKPHNSFESQRSKPHIRNPQEKVNDSHLPLKKPRHSPTPNIPKSNPVPYHHQDDDVQEVVPVKTEPVSLPPEQPVPTFHPPPHGQDVFPADGVVADPNMEYGEDYGDYEGYDGGYDGGVLDHSGMQVGLQDGNKDFATTISEVLAYNPDTKLWECAICGRSNSDKNQIRRHAEVHFKGFIHTCPYCGVEKKTSTALRVHIHRFHTKKQ